MVAGAGKSLPYRFMPGNDEFMAVAGFGGTGLLPGVGEREYASTLTTTETTLAFRMFRSW